MVCVRCVVSGKVQGVFYRASTQKQAYALNITGYAKNLSDGRVEVFACGDQFAIEQFQDWLWQGPTAARVEQVSCQKVESTATQGFSIT